MFGGGAALPSAFPRAVRLFFSCTLQEEQVIRGPVGGRIAGTALVICTASRNSPTRLRRETHVGNAGVHARQPSNAVDAMPTPQFRETPD
jgi:hypothetical protein